MDIANTKQKTRIDGPDILRGFAAIAVIIVHLIAFSGLNFGSTITQIGSKFTAFVTLFFSISAFSIAYSYKNNIFTEKNFIDFYIKRFFRLAPLFYLAMLIEAIIVYVLYNHTATALEIILSLTFLFTFVPSMHDSLVWAGWSLGIEWIFYLLYPIMFFVVRNNILFFATWIISLLISTHMGYLKVPHESIYFNFLNHSVFFICGIGVFINLNRLESIKNKLGIYSSPLSLSVMIIVISYLLLYFYNPTNKFNIYITYSTVWFILLCSSIIGIPKFLNNKFTRFIGKSSYSIYLIHSIVILFLREIGFYQLVNTLTTNTKMLFLLAAMPTIIIAIAISYLTYRFIEVPGMALGKYVVKNYNQNDCSGVSRKISETS